MVLGMETTTTASVTGTLMREVTECPGCDLDHGWCVRHPFSVDNLAHELLNAAELTPERRLHSIMVGRRARALSHEIADSPHAADLLAAAGTLHDIGYAYPDTGHHAIDGARWARRNGLPEQLVSLVAHHSTSPQEADVLGLSAELREFDRVQDWKHAVIWAADFTTGPDGSPVSPRDRLAGIRGRYPDDSPVLRALDAAEPRMWALFARFFPARFATGWLT